MSNNLSNFNLPQAMKDSDKQLEEFLNDILNPIKPSQEAIKLGAMDVIQQRAYFKNRLEQLIKDAERKGRRNECVDLIRYWSGFESFKELVIKDISPTIHLHKRLEELGDE